MPGKRMRLESAGNSYPPVRFPTIHLTEWNSTETFFFFFPTSTLGINVGHFHSVVKCT